MKEYWEIGKLAGGIFLLAMILVAVLSMLGVGWTVHFNWQTCERLERLAPQYEFDFDFYGGCLVQLDSGRWVSTDSIDYLEGDLNITTD